jgi:signal transduction histidine kinase
MMSFPSPWRIFGKIGANLIAVFILLSVLPVGIMLTLALNQAADQAEQQTTNQLESLTEVKTSDIGRWIANNQSNLSLILNNQAQRERMAQIASSERQGGTAVTLLNQFLLEQLLSQESFVEYFVYDNQGLIRASTAETQIGRNISDQLYFAPGFAGQTITAPYYDAESGNLQMIVTQPLLNPQGQLVGRFAGRVDLRLLNEIMTGRVGLGDTGETYLLTAEGSRLLTPSRFSGYTVGTRYSSLGIQNALRQEDGAAVYTNYRGVEVIGVYRWIPALQAGLIAEVERDEALQTIRGVRQVSLLAALVVVIGAIIVGVVMTRWLTRPILHLTRVAQALIEGDYSQRAGMIPPNELGELATAFNTMTERLVSRLDEISQKNTALEKATQQAQEATRLKSEFLATFSHELRTPMNAILGFSDALQSGIYGELNDMQMERMGRLQRSAKRLLNLINDILDLSKIEAGRMELVPRPISPSSLLFRISSQMAILPEKADLKYEVNISPELPTTVLADEKRIEQIVVNLLSNAFKFTSEGSVRLVSYPLNGQWIIEVADTGIGISEEAQAFIFEQFRQVEGGYNRTHEGTGLGLAITRQLAQIMGGTVSLSSQVGVGSTFTVSLPMVLPSRDTNNMPLLELETKASQVVP